MIIPISGISIGLDCIFAFMAWLFIRDRIAKNGTMATPSITYLHTFFLYFALFFAVMGAPHLLLYVSPEHFSQAMAIGYTVGHVFLFISLIYLFRMLTSIVPAWNKYQKPVVFFGVAMTFIITLLEVKQMVLGETKPFYIYNTNITNLNVPAGIGAMIALFVIAAFLPSGILFTISAAKTQGAKRRRAILLAAGMYLVIVAGPLHDNARHWRVFLFADIITGLASLLITAGVVYRLETATAPQATSTTTEHTL